MTTWPAPPATIPLRARAEAPTLDDAAVLLAGAAITTGTIVLRNWDALAASPDAAVLRDLMATFGTYVVRSAEGLTCTSRSTSGHLTGISYDLTNAPALAGIAVVLASLADGPSRLIGIGRAPRVPEILENLNALGGHATTNEIIPQPLHAGDWPAHGDPLLGAYGAVLGLVVPGVRITGDPGDRRLREIWGAVLTADENILPGTTTGTVPYYT